MKINSIDGIKSNSLKFRGKREATNAVSQLAKNNSYSLTEPNQRHIINSIKELSKYRDLKTVKFLMDTAAKLKYSTNIVLKHQPKNNWKSMLLTAAASLAALIPALAQTDILNKIAKIENNTKLNSAEREILNLKKQLLAVVDLEEVNNNSIGPAKDFEKNLDYFIISSETTLEHKKYVLERLNYFMSDEYEINPQLKDKKSTAVAEMINDMALAVPGNKIPNIKAVNQKQHGMCGAISIVRKKLAYEDKPNYVDSIISELDSSDSISVYDRNQLGSGKKILVQKVPVDFENALAKGYRIIDASTMHWMQIADMSGATNRAFNEYNPFDKDNFDVKTDSFLNIHFEEPELKAAQEYYQALILAKNKLENYKASMIKKDILETEHRQNKDNVLKLSNEILNEIKGSLKSILPDLSTKQIQNLTSDILKLEKENSGKISQTDKFSYIPNEEDIMKKEKIKNFIENKFPIIKISEKSTDEIFTLISYYKEIQQSVHKSSKIAKAQKLYDVAASFRYQIIKSLEEKQTLENIIQNEGILPKEQLLLNHIDNLINKLSKNSPHSDLILSQLENVFEGIEHSNEDGIMALYSLKESIHKLLTEELDKVYDSLNLGNSKEALDKYIEESINQVANGNWKLIEAYSETLGVKKTPNSVIKALEKLQNQLRSGKNEDFKKVFAKLRNTSQITYIKQIFQNVMNNLNLDENDPAQKNLKQQFENLKLGIDSIENFIDTCNESLRIFDESGDILFSSEPKDVVIKKLEYDKRIASSKDLRELQTHFEKINKERSNDEFQSRRGKLKDKSLENFSVNEKNLLRETEKSINPMMSYVQKQLNYVRSDMKDMLESLKQYIGVNSGNYWVNEGSSGLYKTQQLKVLEYMTGRPHKVSTNLKTEIEKIKKSPYSGITGSSVYHNDHGWHAQYIADITPVKIKTKDGKEETKDVLFQDNSWGACEEENTWVDSLGLKRTDYSDFRGGTHGYITNKDFRNGNLVDRVTGDMVVEVQPDNIDNRIYKRLKHDDAEIYTSPQYADIIVDGISPEIHNTADRIHDAIFAPSSNYVDKLEKLAEKLKESEIKGKIRNIQITGNSWKDDYEKIKSRIFAPNNIGEEDYNKLPDNDYLKITLEKIALKKRGSIAGLETKLAAIRSVKELSRFNGAQKTRAVNSFKYAFSKDYKLVDFLADSFSQKEEEQIENILEKYNIKLSDEEFGQMVTAIGINLDKFNGSAKTTIKLIMNILNEEIDNIISHPDANKEIKQLFKNYLKDKIYFNESDLNNNEIQHLVKFIDRVFNPSDNKEFVKIFRQIQDMTIEEFNKNILSKADYSDMGIKQVSGYDILKSLRRYEKDINTELLNTIYYDNIVAEGRNNDFSSIYKYKKLTRSPRFLFKNTFDKMYEDIKNDLSILDFPKLFNKYKNRNISKYGAYPAYPKTNPLNESFLQTSFENTFDAIEVDINTIININNQIKNYELAEELNRLKNRTKPETKVKGEKFNKLTNILGQLLDKCDTEDISVKDIIENAETALEYDEGTKFSQYIPHIDKIIEIIFSLKNTSSKELLESVAKNKMLEIKAFKHAYADTLIQERYKAGTLEKLNKFSQLMIKQEYEKAGILKAELYEDLAKKHIINNPKELLDSYLKSCTKDSQLNKYSGIFKSLLNHALSYAKLTEVQDIIMEAVSEGAAMNTKTGFNNLNILLSDGNYYSMGSDEIIVNMINQLLGENNNETANLFVEKLGLGDKYIKYTLENTDLNKLKENIDKGFAIAKNYENFKNEIAAKISDCAEKLENNSSVLLKLKNGIKKSAKQNSIDSNTIKPLLAAIDNIKYNLENNDKAQKQIVFTTLIEGGLEKVGLAVRSQIKEKDDILNAHATILNFINQILIEEDSEADKLREDFNHKFEDILNYKIKLSNLQENE